MLIDTHCHLDAAEFAPDREAVLGAARAAGVGAFVVPAVSLQTCADVRDLCRCHPDCYPAYGLHPLYVSDLDPLALSHLRDFVAAEMAGDQAPVAIGETGLDYYVPGFDAECQRLFFHAQLRLAREFDLPVILHVRRAVDDVLAGLRRIRVRGGVAHAFNGSRQQAEALIALGFKLGFGGAMTYAGSSRIRRLASELPLESLVLETDAPDMAPRWLSGQRNDPAQLPRIADELGALRGLSRAQVADACAHNTKMLFGLKV